MKKIILDVKIKKLMISEWLVFWFIIYKYIAFIVWLLISNYTQIVFYNMVNSQIHFQLVCNTFVKINEILRPMI